MSRRSQPALFDTGSGADFSPCRTWRYRLWRRWSDGPALNAICLNPSTADEHTDDPTVRRLLTRAHALGFPALVVTNLFALRSTDPRVLRNLPDPVGPENDARILSEARSAALVLCAWGRGGALRARGLCVGAMLREERIPLYVLRIGKDGSPAHPLYLPYALEPVRWR